MKGKGNRGVPGRLFFFFLVVLGFELRASGLLKQVLYHLKHSTSPVFRACVLFGAGFEPQAS
jgi:hypothetical protein